MGVSRLLCAVLLLAAAAVAGCGGLATHNDDGGNGAMGGGAESVPECARSDDCRLLAADCCAPCEPAEVAEYRAVPTDAWDELAAGCLSTQCTACPVAEQMSRTTPYFITVCVDGRCAAEDVRDTALGVCVADGDCHVRRGTDCCESCVRTDYVAVNARADAAGGFCRDGQAACSSACEAPVPSALTARCENGRCKLATYCPATPPPPGPCPGVDTTCDYGACCGGYLSVVCSASDPHWRVDYATTGACVWCDNVVAGGVCPNQCGDGATRCIDLSCGGAPVVHDCVDETWVEVMNYCERP